MNSSVFKIRNSTYSNSDLEEALALPQMDFETFMREEERKESEDFDIVNSKERYNTSICNKILYSSNTTNNSTLTVEDPGDTTKERNVLKDINKFQFKIQSQSLLSSIDDNETVPLEDDDSRVTISSQDQSQTIPLDRGVSACLNDSSRSLLLNATCHDHSSDSWMMEDLKDSNKDERQTLIEGEDDEDSEITLEDSILNVI